MSTIIAAALSVMGSVAVICVTHFMSKRLKFFEVFFHKKVDAYSRFWKAISEVRKDTSDELLRANTRTELYYLAMFSTDDTYCEAVKLVEMVFAKLKGSDVALQSDVLIGKMRDELNSWQRFKFQ